MCTGRTVAGTLWASSTTSPAAMAPATTVMDLSDQDSTTPRTSTAWAPTIPGSRSAKRESRTRGTTTSTAPAAAANASPDVTCAHGSSSDQVGNVTTPIDAIQRATTGASVMNGHGS